jgi:hypothetical protein
MLGRALAIGILLSAMMTEARADEDEASLHFQLLGGLARVGDEAAERETSTTPMGGIQARASYATNDWYQLDAALSLAATGGAHFSLGTFMPAGLEPISGPFDVSMQLARVDVGVTARLGVRFIPTARLAFGTQGRRTSSPSGFPGTVRDPTLGVDLVGVGSLGFDYRVNRRTIIGVAVGGTYAVPLGGADYQSVEATVFWSRYWYPGW